MFVVFVSYGPVSSFYVTSTINIEEKEAKKKKIERLQPILFKNS